MERLRLLVIRNQTSVLAIMMLMLAYLTGCSPDPGTHDPGYVAKEWSMTMREFGIVPVFPPREDVQVGDVYALPIPPEAQAQFRAMRANKGQFLPIPVLMASIDFSRELDEHYKRRFSFPPTPSSQPATQPNVFPQPTTQATGGVFATGTVPDRLRLGGFPEFFSAQISEGGINAVIPTEAVNIAFGALASANKRVRVSVPMVESYGLPAGKVLAKLNANSPPGTPIKFGDGNAVTTIDARQLVALTQPAGGFDEKTQEVIDQVKRDKKAKGYLVVITEVYATRSIDISIEAEVSNAAGLNLKPTAELLSKLPGFSATQPTTQPAATQPASRPIVGTAQYSVSTPAQIAASMTNQLNEYLASSTPGVNVKFLSVTAFGVSMRRTYERPIVIGYRGVVYRLDGNSKLEIAGSASMATPTARQVLTLRMVKAVQDAAAAKIGETIGERVQVSMTFGRNYETAGIVVNVTPDPTTPPNGRNALQAKINANRDAVKSAIEDVVGEFLGKPILVNFP